MDYFPHDTRALSDDKLLALRLQHGGEAVFCYWAILEKIYADEQPFCYAETNVEAMSVLYRIGVGFDVLEKYIVTMVQLGLLYPIEGSEKTIMSKRASAQIDALVKKRETARQNGKKHTANNSVEPTGNQQETNVGTNVGSIKTLNNKRIKKDNTTCYPKKFIKPTVEELAAYAAEKGYGTFDAHRFFDWYESNGWKVGKNPMKDWKAAVRSWVSRDTKKGGEHHDYSRFDR